MNNSTHTPTLEEHLATLNMRELRRYQSIVQQQIPMAYKQGNTKALVKLQAMDDATTEAIGHLAFGRPEFLSSPVCDLRSDR